MSCKYMVKQNEIKNFNKNKMFRKTTNILQ